MKLIFIILALVAERYIVPWQDLRQLSWLSRYFDFMQGLNGQRRFWHGYVGVMLMLLPPLLLVVVIYLALYALFAPLGFLFALLILILSLGPMNLDAQVKAFLASREQGDEQGAVYHAQVITLNGGLQNSDNMTPEVIKGIFHQSMERYFSVFFWFIVLGPVGAILIRLACLMQSWSTPDKEAGESFESGFYLAIKKVKYWLDWPVVRVIALGLGISGSFVDFWQANKRQFLADNAELLITGGYAALQRSVHKDEHGGLVLDDIPDNLEEEMRLIRGAMAMVKRTLKFGLGVLALMTLYGLLL
ncbi:MAG: regulatory signaling modulator protein AmpE [Gammaproteobacteria bacterium]|nr:regulatory signaling modulator protein AmpE [Gammaproteobacteria bacterium]